MNIAFRIILSSFFFLSFGWALLAQSDTDSLEIKLEFERDPSKKIELLQEVARQLQYVDIEKSLNYSQQALDLSNNIDDTKAIINSSLLLSDLYWSKTAYKEAMNWALSAEEMASKNDDKKGLAQSYLRLGAIYSSIDNYLKSSEYYFNSLKIFRELKEKKFEGIVLNNIGNVFSDQKKYEKAAEYFSDALNIATDVKDSIGVKIGLTNYASALSNMNKYEKAKMMMERVIKLNGKDDINPWYGANVLNLAIVNQNLGVYDAALVMFNKALTIFNQLGDEYYIARSYYYLADFYSEIDNYEKSISYAIVALEKGQEYGFQRVVLDVSGLLQETYSKQNRKDEAYKYLLLQYQVKDSLYKEENITKISNLELQYEFDKEQQEKLIKQERKDFITIISIVLLLLAVISVLARLKIKSKNNLLTKQKLESELDSKNKEFAVNVLYLMKKNEMLSNISEKLIQIEKEAVKDETKRAIHQIGFILKKNKEKDVWEEFELRFKQVHKNFYENITKQYPDLTSNDLRICSFLKLNMSTKEISDITGHRIATLEATRSRIRKKLGISKTHVDLVAFLSQF